MTAKRMLLEIIGVVQGVGFRPFVYNLAHKFELTGYIQNSSSGVRVEIEGQPKALSIFVDQLHRLLPEHARIHNIQTTQLDPKNYSTFEIRDSLPEEIKSALMLPDVATCDECLADIFDPNNLRYLYPFTNCTHCGPRYSIIQDLPYDRTHTTMNNFTMCPECQSEYDDPENRRFHAQPNACPRCGPQLILLNAKGKSLAHRHEALIAAVKRIRDGQIVAIKGIGGYQLCVNPYNHRAVQLLRERKCRPKKPFALMVPSLSWANQLCRLSDVEKAALSRPEAPIVLLQKREEQHPGFSDLIAPDNPSLGLMLPYSPLHHILMRELGHPIIATSANISDEPICYQDDDARHRLAGIADVFLTHNRRIVRPIDDSVVRIINEQPLVLRRARGFAPLPLKAKQRDTCLVAVGAHLKNTIAYQSCGHIFLSQHIGDLQGVESMQTFEDAISDFQDIYEQTPTAMACDLHPGYLSTQYAQNQDLPVISVQHHHAHIVSCMCEHQIDEEVLGMAFDGTGYDPDGTVWGGEFLTCTRSDYQRIASLYPFALPGGTKAIEEPRRAALGLLHELSDEWREMFTDTASVQSFNDTELKVLDKLMQPEKSCLRTSSMGRLFDGVASLLGLVQCNGYEGEAAMRLEFAIGQSLATGNYSYEIVNHNQLMFADWRPMIHQIIEDIRAHVSTESIATKFHNTIIELSLDIARKSQRTEVVLSGGCFQNAYLAEHLCKRLSEAGFRVYTHQNVPPNDGGIALGQAAVAEARLTTRSHVGVAQNE